MTCKSDAYLSPVQIDFCGSISNQAQIHLYKGEANRNHI
jgi:hypothetical protein